MKLSREELKKLHFYEVAEGFQVLPRASVHEFQTVTEETAVKDGDRVFCTERWFARLEKMTGMQLSRPSTLPIRRSP